MKFKSKEELLRNKEKNANSRDASCFSDSYSNGIEDAFMTFKQRINFYNKYKNCSFVQLGRDQPEALESLKNYLEDKFGNEDYLPSYEQWNTWLFQYCFGDIE